MNTIIFNDHEPRIKRVKSQWDKLPEWSKIKSCVYNFEDIIGSTIIECVLYLALPETSLKLYKKYTIFESVYNSYGLQFYDLFGYKEIIHLITETFIYDISDEYQIDIFKAELSKYLNYNNYTEIDEMCKFFDSYTFNAKREIIKNNQTIRWLKNEIHTLTNNLSEIEFKFKLLNDTNIQLIEQNKKLLTMLNHFTKNNDIIE